MLYISKIQHFSVGDGEGIRTTVFFKGCNLRCPWCHNPENLTYEPVTLHYRTTGICETIGKYVTAEQILSELLEDIDFYNESSGGVTLSGGEVMLQTDAIIDLLKLLKENNVSVLIDTAGCVPYSYFQKINPYVDGYLFDFKTADETNYRNIGGDLDTVTKNITNLIVDGLKLHIRIPLIPKFNTDFASVRKICEHLKMTGIESVELLPFHRLGSSKYEAMGLSYSYEHQPPLTQSELQDIEQIYKEYFCVQKEL